MRAIILLSVIPEENPVKDSKMSRNSMNCFLLFMVCELEIYHLQCCDIFNQGNFRKTSFGNFG